MEAGRGPEAAPAAAGPPPVYQVVGIDVVFACVTTYWQPSAKEWREFAAVCLPFAHAAERGLQQIRMPLACLQAWAKSGRACLEEASGVLLQLRKDLTLSKLPQGTSIPDRIHSYQLLRWNCETDLLVQELRCQLAEVSEACATLRLGAAQSTKQVIDAVSAVLDRRSRKQVIDTACAVLGCRAETSSDKTCGEGNERARQLMVFWKMVLRLLLLAETKDRKQVQLAEVEGLQQLFLAQKHALHQFAPLHGTPTGAD
eukprot:TRINITY_DN8859_c0_g1_i2.p1 TRINITY_DN8859_c0_g1~~TRINITY_DN8859_c0_g1_i2.p1  ORF type:complete len:257 (+),score=48.20 TRINITY_DN8859_c0_g1_i2:69-839(+)